MAKKVTVNLGINTIELWIGKNTAQVNGVNTPIDSTNANCLTNKASFISRYRLA
jgi:hypothetical protein